MILSTVSAGMFFLINHVQNQKTKPTQIPIKVDLSALHPGSSLHVTNTPREMIISIPDGEAHSIGTFEVTMESHHYHESGIPRDGSVESAWISDLNDDGIEDVMFVIRSSGSGSYAELTLLLSQGKGFVIDQILMSLDASVQGYMGHDTITLVGNKIYRSFPTYSDSKEWRLDRQWEIQDGLEGKIPVKKAPDSNSNPSGSTMRLWYDNKEKAWKP